MALTNREKRTLAAVARVLVPSGGSVPHSADDLGLVEKLIEEVEGYPKRARRRMRLLFFATEYGPLVSGNVRRFSRLSPEKQKKALEDAGHHKRSPLRRLVVSYLKQLVYSSYISQGPIEEAVGYRYECVQPREGVSGDGVHH